MHEHGGMRRLLVLLVAAIGLTVGAAGHAAPHPHRRATAIKHHVKTRRHRAGRRIRTVTPLAAEGDEIVLSPALLKQLQRNLIDGGYLVGTADGRLTRRTRRALAEFQRDYHMVGTGALDRATAEALLGSDVIGAYTIAAATH